MILAGALQTIGCAIRYIGVLTLGPSDGTSAYVLVLLGTIFCAMAQPFYLNLPSKIAATWFAISERDISMTLCSLASPLGSAVGSLIPPMIVSEDDDTKVYAYAYFVIVISTFPFTQYNICDT